MVIKKLIKKAYKNLRVIGKPMTMHVEAIYLDEVWEVIKKLVLKNKKKIHTFFVMTPANNNYFKYFFNLKMPKKEMSKKMKERYLWLINHGQKLELHVHGDFLVRLSFDEQEKLISESVKWFKKNLGYMPQEFVPGCWIHNKDTLKIIKKYNIRLIKFSDYQFYHDYELLPQKNLVA